MLYLYNLFFLHTSLSFDDTRQVLIHHTEYFTCACLQIHVLYKSIFFFFLTFTALFSLNNITIISIPISIRTVFCRLWNYCFSPLSYWLSACALLSSLALPSSSSRILLTPRFALFSLTNSFSSLSTLLYYRWLLFSRHTRFNSTLQMSSLSCNYMKTGKRKESKPIHSQIPTRQQ